MTLPSFRQIYSSWRLNGAGLLPCAVNLLALMLVWALLPLEGRVFSKLRNNFFVFFPQIKPDHPRLLDPLRVIIQAVFLCIFKQPGLPDAEAPVKPFTFTWLTALLQKLFKPVSKLTARVTTELTDQFGSRQALMIPRRHRWLIRTLMILSLLCSLVAVTQPFAVTYQFVFVGLMWTLAILLKSAKNRVALMLMIFISVVISTRYIYWRMTKTILTTDLFTMACALTLLAAEIYAYLVLVLSYFQVCWVLDRKPFPLPKDQSLWPSVDVFIPSYNEPLDVVKPCLLAALGMDWPQDRLRVHMLDDGSRPEFERYCREIGVNYIVREVHDHAKAGNINHALKETHGDLVAIFDCDHIPVRAFLQMTVGWMVHDPMIALVQTPHHFYSDDPFEKNLSLRGTIPAENSLFHDFIQKGNDTWNATMFCGSCAVIRRKPLEEIGGIAVETVTEDAHTSLRLNRRGYSSAFISMPLAAGLATESLADHINQRIRWARGMVQIFRIDNPFRGRGLTLPQRICFANAMIHFLHGLPRIIFLIAPLPYLFFNTYIIFASGLAILAFVLPHMVHSTMTNQQIQGNKRFYFWGVVYETILSWYITLPTLVALIFPKLGKFNVTAKGASNEVTYFDWTVSKPYILLILLNFAGMIYGFVKIFCDPYAEIITILINIAWVSYNLLVLGAAAAVANEVRQVRKSPRVRCDMEARLELRTNEIVNVRVSDFSKDGLGLVLPENRHSKILISQLLHMGQEVSVSIAMDGRFYRFQGEVRFLNELRAGVMVKLTTREQNIEYIHCTFARADRWSHSFENLPQDSLLHGIHTLILFGLNGYLKMIRNAPAGFRQALQLVLSTLMLVFSLFPQPLSLRNYSRPPAAATAGDTDLGNDRDGEAQRAPAAGPA